VEVESEDAAELLVGVEVMVVVAAVTLRKRAGKMRTVLGCIFANRRV
jgi:hypothetical protein